MPYQGHLPRGRGTVTVYDDCGYPVSGARVTGDFTGNFEEPGRSGVTDGNGVAVIITKEVKKPSYTFCVNKVVKGGLEDIFNANICPE